MAVPAVVSALGSAASVAVFERTPGDMVASGISGHDCSTVRLEEGKSWCKGHEPPPDPPEFCTRTLGVAECFADPAALPDHPGQLADGPQLNSAQEKDRTARWPQLW